MRHDTSVSTSESHVGGIGMCPYSKRSSLGSRGIALEDLHWECNQTLSELQTGDMLTFESGLKHGYFHCWHNLTDAQKALARTCDQPELRALAIYSLVIGDVKAGAVVVLSAAQDDDVIVRRALTHALSLGRFEEAQGFVGALLLGAADHDDYVATQSLEMLISLLKKRKGHTVSLSLAVDAVASEIGHNEIDLAIEGRLQKRSSSKDDAREETIVRDLLNLVKRKSLELESIRNAFNPRELRWFSSIALRCICAILLLSALWSQQHSFYTDLRWIVFIVGSYIALVCATAARGWALYFAAVALLFNPIWPISLGRHLWGFADVFVAMTLLYSVATMHIRAMTRDYYILFSDYWYGVLITAVVAVIQYYLVKSLHLHVSNLLDFVELTVQLIFLIIIGWLFASHCVRLMESMSRTLRVRRLKAALSG